MAANEARERALDVTGAAEARLSGPVAATMAGAVLASVLAAAAAAEATVPPLPVAACAAADRSIVMHPITPRAVLDAGADAALCEPSAAIVAPWDPALVLVADNERHKQIYLLTGSGDAVRAAGVLDMPGANRPRDLEALAIDGESLVLVGSHGAKSGCRADGKRARLRAVSPGRGGRLVEREFTDAAARLERASRNRASCLDKLFEAPVPAAAGALCDALVAGAAGGEPCRALNVEGAVTDPAGRLWLGLRAPLVEGQAVLLRLADTRRLAFRFDRVVLLDLSGFGVRELARDVDAEQIWGIAGPETDGPAPFRLFSLDARSLAAGDEPAVVTDPRCLPTSTEGLAVRGTSALFLVDGAEHDDHARCASPAGHFTLSLPTAGG